MRLYHFFCSSTTAIVLAFGFLLAREAQANNEMCCEQACCLSSLEIGANYTRANIKVDGQSSLKGNLGGVQGICEYRPWNGFYAGLKAIWKEGKTERSHSNRKLTYVDAQERVGYSYASCCHDWTVTAFSGIGYRYLEHRLKQSHEPSVKFRYSEFYVPLGFLSKYFFSPCWSLGLNATWMPQVFPTVEIVPLKGAHWSLKNTIGNVLIEMPLAYVFQDYCISFILKPFYERWEDGKSTAKTSSGQSLDLPENIYNFWGVEVDFSYAF